MVNTNDREVLWRSLRERALNSQLYRTSLPEADLPPDVLTALLGIQDVRGEYKPSTARLAEEGEW